MHQADRDLVEHPSSLWRTTWRKRQGGLYHHLLADRGDGVAGFTDILMVINEPDFQRSVDDTGDFWVFEAKELLEEQLSAWCKKAHFNQIFPDRPFQVALVCDGSEELRNHRIGLESGQFVTCLLPNRYGGPIETSSPVLAIHLNIPGAWEGYRKVGLLHSDQVFFTLGDHWLDNFSHEALVAPALYQLQQYPDGSLVHVVNPDLQDRFEVGSVQVAEGPAVLAVTERGGDPVAFMVLGVMDTFLQERSLDDEPAAGRELAKPQSKRTATAGRPGGEPAGKPARKPCGEPGGKPARPQRPSAESAPRSAAQPARRTDAPAPGRRQGRSEKGPSKSRIAIATPRQQSAPAPAAQADQPAARRPAQQQAARKSSAAAVKLAGVAATVPPAPRPRARPKPKPPSPAQSPGTGGKAAWHHTIVPDAVEERIFTLKERGALLQRVHFAVFMEGYDVYVSRSGQLGTALVDPDAVFQVREDKVYFMAHREGIDLAGRPMSPGQPVRLRGEVEIRVSNQLLEFRDLTKVAAEGWPYLGEIRRSASSAYMVFGGKYRIGRDRRCKVRLPDEPHNDNIVWRLDMGGGEFIRSRTGDIPKSRFYNDSIMVASEHAEIDLDGEPALRNVARHCYSYIRRERDVFALFPVRDESGVRSLDLLPGDELLVGNNLFEVAYPPASEQQAMEELTAESLARAAQSMPDSSVFDESEAAMLSSRSPEERQASGVAPERPPPDIRGRSYPGRPVAAAPAIEDAPAAAGLGESGPPPEKLSVSDAGFDSLLEVEAPMPAHLAVGEAEPEPSRPLRPPEPPPSPQATRARPESEARSVPAPSASREDVVVVDEESWQLALSRPARLQQLGWMVSGPAVVGNHAAAHVILPENRLSPEQRFQSRDYYRLMARGRRGRVAQIDLTEARLLVNGEPVSRCEDLAAAELEVVRRDEDGAVDFTISLRLRREPWLPNPRASLLVIDDSDRLVSALFTLGIPLRTPIPLQLGALRCRASFDGQVLTISEYLETYARGDGSFHPFLLGTKDGPFRTVPEDGTDFAMKPGDMLISGTAVHRFEVT